MISFLLFHIDFEGKCGWIIGGGGGGGGGECMWIIGGGGKGMLPPPSKIIGYGWCSELACYADIESYT